MAKVEIQSRLLVALKAFTGPLPSSYASETEFFLVSLQDVEEYLADLQNETLRVAREGFIRKLDAGKVAPKDIEAFEAALAKIVPPSDLRTVRAGMAGSKELIKERLSGLRPASLVNEWKKGPGRDPDAEKQIDAAYSRMQFPVLLRTVEADPTDAAANAALAKARTKLSEYCSTYCIPNNAAATFKPISLSCLDAALSAAHSLYKNIRKALGRGM